MYFFSSLLISSLLLLNLISSVKAQEVEIDPQIKQDSPTLKRWLEKIPNILEDIDNDPSFNTHLRLGYLQFPSHNNTSGIEIGVDDLFLGKTALTLTGDYETSWIGNINSGGVNLQYYVLPLGYIINIAPVVGYRFVNNEQYGTDGVNVGGRLKLVLSRNNSADISLTQTFINLGGNNEVGVTLLSTGYAVTPSLRLSAEIQQQNSHVNKESYVGIFLEWILK